MNKSLVIENNMVYIVLFCIKLVFTQSVIIQPYSNQMLALSNDLHFIFANGINKPIWNLDYNGRLFRLRFKTRYLEGTGDTVSLVQGDSGLLELYRSETIKPLMDVLDVDESLSDEESNIEPNVYHAGYSNNDYTDQQRAQYGIRRTHRNNHDKRGRMTRDPIILRSGLSKPNTTSKKPSSSAMKSNLIEKPENDLESNLKTDEKSSIDSNDKPEEIADSTKTSVPSAFTGGRSPFETSFFHSNDQTGNLPDKTDKSKNKSPEEPEKTKELKSESSEQPEVPDKSKLASEKTQVKSNLILSGSSEKNKSNLSSKSNVNPKNDKNIKEKKTRKSSNIFGFETSHHNNHYDTGSGFNFELIPIFNDKVSKKLLIRYNGRCLTTRMRLEECEMEKWWFLNVRYYWVIYPIQDIRKINKLEQYLRNLQNQMNDFNHKNSINIDNYLQMNGAVDTSLYNMPDEDSSDCCSCCPNQNQYQQGMLMGNYSNQFNMPNANCSTIQMPLNNQFYMQNCMNRPAVPDFNNACNYSNCGNAKDIGRTLSYNHRDRGMNRNCC
ncbi:hypothetical protein NUSPORA_00963 [Nucleospora cyclopteri]